jgi:hypothetical protein
LKRLIVAFVVLASLAASASVAFADSPHFINSSASVDSSGALVVSWKEAGLGNNAQVDYTLSADGSATYVCVNKGGKNPSASNKTQVEGPVSASGTFFSGKNGSITASLTAGPPPAGSDFTCPSGQSKQLASVSYTNITLTDTTNNISAPFADIATGCLLPNVKGAC